VLITYRWPVVVLAIAVGAAWMFRYEPVHTGTPLEVVAVWDRWTHQLCAFTFAEAHGRGLYCSAKALLDAAQKARGGK
jgi:hypothetical protein